MMSLYTEMLIKDLWIIDQGLSFKPNSLPITAKQLSDLKYVILRYLDTVKIHKSFRFADTQFGLLLEITFKDFVGDEYQFYIKPNNYFAQYVTPASHMCAREIIIDFVPQKIEALQHSYKKLCSILKNDTVILSSCRKDLFKSCLTAIYPGLEITDYSKSQYLVRFNNSQQLILNKYDFKQNWKSHIDEYEEAIQD